MRQPIDVDAVLAGLPPCRPAIDARIQALPLSAPFRISDHVFHAVDILVVTVAAEGHVGTGEAAGVFYLGDTPGTMLRQIDAVAPALANGMTHAGLAACLPPGGARNALDCALWNWHARRSGKPLWALLGMAPPRPLLTTYTIGNGAPAAMAAKARDHAEARAIKLKLNGDPADADRVRAVRAARPDVWLGVDANRALTPASLQQLLPALAAADVALIEQPFAIGQDARLTGIASPIPIAADESVQTLADLDRLAPLYQVVNIKLDKCGGLTEGLRMAARARALGLGVMVGNMLGSSWAMAPAFLVGQSCDIVDLDGPIFLTTDRTPGVVYRDGLIHCPDTVW